MAGLIYAFFTRSTPLALNTNYRLPPKQASWQHIIFRKQWYRRGVSMAVANGQTSSGIRAELQLLLAAMTQDQELFSRLSQNHAVDWDEFIQLSIQHRVYPLIYQTLKTVSPDCFPAAVKEQLKKLVIEYSFYDDYLRCRLKEVARCLQSSAIKYCLLKGPVLGDRLYGSSALRPSKDLDILVMPEDTAGVIRLLHKLGFRLEKAIPEGDHSNLKRLLGREQHLQLYDSRIEIELHWRLFHPKYGERPQFNTARLLQNTVNHDLDEVAVPTLPPEDELLYLILHGTSHYWYRLRWLHDIFLYSDIYPDANWRKVGERLAEIGQDRVWGQTGLLIRRFYGKSLIDSWGPDNKNTAVGSRHLYNLTLPFITDTQKDLTYHPWQKNFYLKMLYVMALKPDLKAGTVYTVERLAVKAGKTMTALQQHLSLSSTRKGRFNK